MGYDRGIEDERECCLERRKRKRNEWEGGKDEEEFNVNDIN